MIYGKILERLFEMIMIKNSGNMEQSIKDLGVLSASINLAPERFAEELHKYTEQMNGAPR